MNLDNNERYYLKLIIEDLEDLEDEETAEEIKERLVELTNEPDIKNKEVILLKCIESLIKPEDDEIDNEDDIYELTDRNDRYSLILNLINFSGLMDDVLYPDSWSEFDIIEMAKVFAIDKLEIDPEYLKTIYNTYYKKCKTPISKFGIKLSYYNSLLIKKLNDKSIEISKEELEELFKLGIFQKCLDEKWAIIIPFNGPFCSQFNDYIINKDEKPNYILESDINIINYLYEFMSIISEGLGEITLEEDKETKDLLQQFKEASSGDELEEIARDGVFKDFIKEKRNQVLDKRKRENNNIPTDVFCAILINACASPMTIEKIINDFNINKKTFNSSDIFDLMTIFVYAEQKLIYEFNGEDFNEIGKSLYKLIRENKGKQEILFPKALKVKINKMFNRICDLLPKFNLNFKKQEVELE